MGWEVVIYASSPMKAPLRGLEASLAAKNLEKKSKKVLDGKRKLCYDIKVQARARTPLYLVN